MFLEPAEEPPCSFCKASFLSGITSQCSAIRRNCLIFSDLFQVNLEANHCSFKTNNLPFQPNCSFASIGTNLGLVFLPVKCLVLHLKRFGAHSKIVCKVSPDVLRLTGFLECLLRQLLDLDGCQLFLIPVDRQLSWCCNIKLDEICWSSSECEFLWCYTPWVTLTMPALMELSMSRAAASARFGHGVFGPNDIGVMSRD